MDESFNPNSQVFQDRVRAVPSENWGSHVSVTSLPALPGDFSLGES